MRNFAREYSLYDRNARKNKVEAKGTVLQLTAK